MMIGVLLVCAEVEGGNKAATARLIVASGRWIVYHFVVDPEHAWATMLL